MEKIEQIIKQTPNFLTAKIPVGIKNPEPGFNIAANIIGKGGINVKHITQVSGGTRVQLKGKGSGYKEPNENEGKYYEADCCYLVIFPFNLIHDGNQRVMNQCTCIYQALISRI